MPASSNTISLNPENQTLRGFPSHTVCALFDAQSQLDQAADELHEGGVPKEDVLVWSGHDGASALHPEGHERGFFSRLAESLQHVSAERTYVDRYAELVKEGKTAIGVRYHDDDDRRAFAQQVLRRCGGAKMFDLGDWTLTVLDR